MSMARKVLDAKSLRSELWATLQDLRSGAITPREADKVARLAREIVNATQTQLWLLEAGAERKLPDDLTAFANPGTEGS